MATAAGVSEDAEQIVYPTGKRRPLNGNGAPHLQPEGAEVVPWPVGGRGKPAIGSARVSAVHREDFMPDLVTHSVAYSEGFPHPAAFRETWERLNGTLGPVDVWRIELAAPMPTPPRSDG